MLRYIDYNPSLSIRMSTPVISTHCLSFHLPLANGGSKKPFMEVNEVLEIEDDVKSRGCFGSSTGPKRALGVQCASHPYNSHCLQWGSRKVGQATGSLIDCFYNSCSTTTTAHGCVCFLHVLIHSWLHIACFRGNRHIWFDFNHLQPSKFLTRCTCETLRYLASAVNGTKSEGFCEDIDGSFCLNGFMSESSSVTYEARLLSQCVW